MSVGREGHLLDSGHQGNKYKASVCCRRYSESRVIAALYLHQRSSHLFLIAAVAMDTCSFSAPQILKVEIFFDLKEDSSSPASSQAQHSDFLCQSPQLKLFRPGDGVSFRMILADGC